MRLNKSQSVLKWGENALVLYLAAFLAGKPGPGFPKNALGRTRGFAILLGLALLAGGCASPARSYDKLAAAADFTATVYQAARFHHKIYRNGVQLRSGVLHVFIEGDAAVATAVESSPPDPTPRRALMLRLMKRDSDAAILLGRACYHGAFEADQCEIRHLGRERYSAEIVNSMISALRSEIQQAAVKRVVLFGYSGGGALAMLMAAKMPEVSVVVTLAANLDNDALTAYHGSPALSGSDNPANLAPLAPSVAQLHFFGELDQIVSVSLARKALARQGAIPLILPGIDHDCCWEEQWPEIIRRLQRFLPLAMTQSERPVACV